MAGQGVTVIGAGVSGLAAAVKLAEAGVPVTLLEAAPQAGGRCRSFYDETLGALIDNGNHMLLSGNWAAHRYQEIIGSEDSMTGPELPEFSFFEAVSGRRWSLRMTGPLSMLSKKGRPPGVGMWAFLFSLVRILTAKPGDTVADRIDTSSPVFHRFWEPLALAILNTPVHEASAWLLNEVLQETFMKGAAASRPLMAREGLTAAFIDPALAYLKAKGAGIRFGQRLQALEIEGGRVRAAVFPGWRLEPGKGEAIVLALPPRLAASLLPGLPAPSGAHAIVNVHFHLPANPEGSGIGPITAILGGTAQWLFLRDRIASVTISAADELALRPSEEIAGLVWSDVAKALQCPADPLPPYRVIKEKRATFAQTPGNLQRRAAVDWGPENLFLAGDWTDTGLPATIEGSIRSGFKAAETILSRRQEA